MKVTVEELLIFREPKVYAKINFCDHRPGHLPHGVAVAFPYVFHLNEKISLTADDLIEALEPGNECNVIWSKKLNSYVVCFSH